MGTIQPSRCAIGYEELGSIGVPPRIGHGQETPLVMLERQILVCAIINK